MDFLKLTVMSCILCSQIEAEKVCPNNFTYIFGDKCYSMHVDIEYKYADAVEFCQKQGGILWSRASNEELEFLKKVHAKIRRFYWVGIRQVGLNWTYLSDNSLGSESLFYKLKSEGTHCQYIETEGETGSISCNHKIYTACEYIGETCEAKKSEDKDCYEFSDTPKNFTYAAKTCKLFGGRLAEYRDHNQLMQLGEALWKYNMAFDDIPIEQIKVSTSSWFPTIWNLQHELQHEKSCETYKMNTIQKEDCAESYNFVCKIDAISAVTYANDYPNSSKPCTELGTQEARSRTTRSQSKRSGTAATLTSTPNCADLVETPKSDSAKFLSMNKTQGIWWLDHNNSSCEVINITVIIVGAIIIIALIIPVIIQIQKIRWTKDMHATSSSNSTESANTDTVQNNHMQRSLPERPCNSSSHYLEMRSFPDRNREVSLQHHYVDITETVVPSIGKMENSKNFMLHYTEGYNK